MCGLWIRTWGGTGRDSVATIVPGPSGSWFASGVFQQTVVFDPGAGKESRTAVSVDDTFLGRWAADGSLSWVRTWGGDVSSFQPFVVFPNGAVVFAGTFAGTVDFDPGPGTDARTAGGMSDISITRYRP